jgi:DNA polymerase-3 subunit gamma/tau
VRYKEQGERCSVKWLYDALGVTTQCEAGYRLASNARLHIEFALMRLAFLRTPDASAAPSADASKSANQAPKPGSGAVPLETVAARGLVNGRGPSDSLGGMSEAKLSGGTGSAAGSDVGEEEKKKRTPKKASSLSLSALLSSDDEPEVMPATGMEAAEAPAEKPTEETLGAKWKELAAMYGSQPRLANALAQASLSFREEDGRQIVEFTVTNEAQKKWIEERILRDLEDKYAKLVGTGRIRLEPTVLPEQEQAPRIYMPSEKAEVLISNNEEVRNLVVDLGLDIK